MQLPTHPNPPVRPVEVARPMMPVEWGWPPGYYPPPPRPSRAGEVIKALALGAAALFLISLTIGVLAIVVLLAGTLTTATDALTGAGSRLDQSVEAARSAVASAGQRLADAADPTHPPREGLVLDTEIESFKKASVGETLGEADGYRFTLREIRLRDGPAGPDERQFAVVHRERIVPQGRSVLGIPLPADREEADYYLDRGELFQIGPTLYKVNWVSASLRQVGVTTLRYPDQAAGPIAFRAGGSGATKTEGD
ncbi:MAG TPA: hypothetical protein VHL09_01110 [Dehalococcoidia bacterium]|nr:hypothetical protein [Dehalococcoidia bacterium]